MSKLEKVKDIHDNIIIPDNLENVIDDACDRYNKEQKMINIIDLKKIGAIAASMLIMFSVGVNTSEAFAMNVYEIPVISEFAKLVTFVEYDIETEFTKGEINIPVVESDEESIESDKKIIEEKINNIIQIETDRMINEQEELNEEYKKAFLATGGKEENYNKVEVMVGYEEYFIDEKYMSFMIYKYETLAPAYNEELFYNFDLETGEQINIFDITDKDIKDVVRKQIEENIENGINVVELEYLDDITIDEERAFYIDKNGDVIIIFPKYEIASGAAGKQEFVIDNIN